jgi:hypothetical protein
MNVIFNMDNKQQFVHTLNHYFKKIFIFIKLNVYIDCILRKDIMMKFKYF